MDTHEVAPSSLRPPDGDLFGAWVLQSVRELDAGGAVLAEPYGEHPRGRLHYGPGGRMAVLIREYGDAPAVAYIGDFDTTADGRLRHVVHVGLPPFAEDQVRWARLEDDCLVLATEREGRLRIELRWERI